MVIWDAVIIGAGPAGCTAALYAAQGGLSVLVMEKEAAGGQMTRTAEIGNWPGEPSPHVVDGITLGDRMRRQAEAAGAVFRYGTVTDLTLTGEIKTVLLENAPVYGKNLILAMGAVPGTLDLPGEESFAGRGISFCAACDGRLYRDGNVLVVGGGNTAAHDTEYLARLCRHVTLIHRRNTFRIPDARVEKLRALPNVTIMTPYTLTAYHSTADPSPHITAAVLTHTETGSTCTLDCDGIFLAIGTRPNTALVKDRLPLTPSGAIETDTRCRTSMPGVYAIGDCRSTDCRQIITACADGCRAAMDIMER